MVVVSREIELCEFKKFGHNYGFLPCLASDKQMATACQNTEKYSVWHKPVRRNKNRQINKLTHRSEVKVFNT